MSPEEFNALRLEVKKLIAGQDLDIRGCRPKLVASLSKKLERKINDNSLAMALTGYRQGAASAEILRNLKEILSCDYIHTFEGASNQNE